MTDDNLKIPDCGRNARMIEEFCAKPLVKRQCPHGEPLSVRCRDCAKEHSQATM